MNDNRGQLVGGEPTVAEEFRRGWAIMLCCVMGATLGVLAVVPGLAIFMSALSEAFGWSRTEMAVAVSFHTAGLFVTFPLVGRLCDRVGIRRVVPIAIVLLAVTYLGATQITGSIWTLYLVYFLLGILAAGTGYLAYARVITSWFNHGRGLALSLLMSGPGVAGIILPLLLPKIIGAYGWQGGYAFMAIAALVPLPFVLFYVREAARPVARGESTGVSVREAVRSPAFLLMAAGLFSIGVCLIGLHMHLIGITLDAGASPASAARSLSIYATGMLLGRLLTGALLDRFRSPLVIAALFCLPVVGIVVFQLAGLAAAPLLAFGLGVALGCESDGAGYLTSRYFGERSYAEIFGWLFNIIVASTALSPFFIGQLHHWTGGYGLALWVSAGNCLLAAAFFVALRIWGPPVLPPGRTAAAVGEP